MVLATGLENFRVDPATVVLYENSQLIAGILQVENDTNDAAEPIHFSPGSISERADALGGSTEVLWTEGRTILRVAVPL